MFHDLCAGTWLCKCKPDGKQQSLLVGCPFTSTLHTWPNFQGGDGDRENFPDGGGTGVAGGGGGRIKEGQGETGRQADFFFFFIGTES